MEKPKKLKDLKVGDSMWVNSYTNTTPISVKKKKRDGPLVSLTLKWDKSEYECFGHALGYVCVGYCKSYRHHEIFTTDYDSARERENRQNRYEKLKDVGLAVRNLIRAIDKIK